MFAGTNVHIMIKRKLIAILGVVICLSLFGCRKEENSPLAGTSWECVEEPEIFVFTDNHSGICYVKSATDGVYDEIYSSLDFTYDISGKNIKIRIYYSRFDSMYDFKMVDDNTLTCGVFHYKKIQHKEHQSNTPL